MLTMSSALTHKRQTLDYVDQEGMEGILLASKPSGEQNDSSTSCICIEPAQLPDRGNLDSRLM